MALYELECDFCGLRSDHMMGMNDSLDNWVECPHCNGQICRRLHRIYDVPLIQGETVAGGCSYERYDEGLGEYVTSKKHRQELMDRKGLCEYAPDPEMKKHRDEARYIKARSRKNDPDAVAAVQKEYKTASDKRRIKQVTKSLDKSLSKLDA